MADISVTAASVKKNSKTIIGSGTAGETVTAGQAVYKNADGKLYLADADLSKAAAAAVGVALHGASADQPLEYVEGGEYEAGGTTAVGTIYVASGTAGGIQTAGDLASNDWTTVIGVGGASNTIKVNIFASGQQLP